MEFRPRSAGLIIFFARNQFVTKQLQKREKVIMHNESNLIPLVAVCVENMFGR